MSIDKITAKIISDAEASAKALLDQAQREHNSIIADAEKKAEAIQTDGKKRGLEDKEKLVHRRRAVADIDGRKMILETKQQLIQQCFEKATKQIAALDQEEYLDFLAAAVKRTGAVEGQLILNNQDMQTLGEMLIDKVARAIPESRITLSQETRNIQGGFLLKNGSVYINGTIESMIEEAREAMVSDVADVLFR